MKYQQFAGAIALAAFGPFAAAQDLLECVDPDVRAGLLGSAYEGGTRYATDLPDVVSDLAIPDGLSLIGTAESDVVLRVAFRSDLAVDEALDVLVAALASAGWQAVPTPQLAASGFVSGPRPAARTMLCRDEGVLTATSFGRGSATYVNLDTVRTGNAAGFCAQAGAVNPFRAPGADLPRFMPRFEMPDDGRRDDRPRGLSTIGSANVSGSTREVRTEVEFVAARDAGSLAAFFGDQLRAQDWRSDVEWAGSTVAGSAWTASRIDASNGETVELVGVLDVTRSGQERYVARFRLTRLDD